MFFSRLQLNISHLVVVLQIRDRRKKRMQDADPGFVRKMKKYKNIPSEKINVKKIRVEGSCSKRSLRPS